MACSSQQVAALQCFELTKPRDHCAEYKTRPFFFINSTDLGFMRHARTCQLNAILEVKGTCSTLVKLQLYLCVFLL